MADTDSKVARITFETPDLLVVILKTEMAFEAFHAKVDCVISTVVLYWYL